MFALLSAVILVVVILYSPLTWLLSGDVEAKPLPIKMLSGMEFLLPPEQSEGA